MFRAGQLLSPLFGVALAGAMAPADDAMPDGGTMAATIFSGAHLAGSWRSAVAAILRLGALWSGINGSAITPPDEGVPSEASERVEASASRMPEWLQEQQASVRLTRVDLSVVASNAYLPPHVRTVGRKEHCRQFIWEFELILCLRALTRRHTNELEFLDDL